MSFDGSMRSKAMDVLGNKEARVYVSAIKAMVPEKVCQIIDQAIQMAQLVCLNGHH